MTTRSCAVAIALLLLVSDCKDANKPDPTLDGSWSGGYTEAVVCTGMYIPITMALAQSDSAISGIASVGGGASNVGVSGTYTYPQVSLRFRFPASSGFGGFNFTGTLANATTMTGHIDYCGWDPATFTRQ